jgi:hypothetical protein
VDAHGNSIETEGGNTSVLAALKGLRWLEVVGGVFSPGVLRGMIGLQHLAVLGAVLPAAAPAGEGGQQQQQQEEEQEVATASSPLWDDSWGESSDEEGLEQQEQQAEDEGPGVGLTVLNQLKQLQHLELSVLDSQPPPTKADVAALTASTQLTCLMVDGGLGLSSSNTTSTCSPRGGCCRS